ncbi:High cysteine membrane protein Group 4 [Giardia lamblia P15]|uniref:High cysteine membrane protein Group 4 n=1 Tax=Giardia intestinalis (strain P15) TaxID=658858 RepID=E1F478_GIAIA|nr:High cysteine membrane protein Group 4 [Giardia lamblia P15]
MLSLLASFLLGSSCGISADTYRNSFGAECKKHTGSCARDRCLFIGHEELCTQCIPGYVPINGTCQQLGGGSSVCIPDDASSPTRCVECRPETGAFLFYGGCYTVDQSAIGGDICLQAAGGRCTECNTDADGRHVFANPDAGAAERCILCSDTVGFGGYRGVSGCLDCMQPISNNIGVALCTRCNYAEKDNGIGPIDYQCQAKGLHNCINGYCTSCYKTHLPYSGGCYSRHTATGFAVCAEANQYELDNVTVCTECADTSHAPRNGAYTLVSASGSLFSDCTKDADRGLCTGCSSAGKSFLFYGGCYDRSSHIGSRLCSEVAGGACKQWRSSFDFTFSKAGGTERYLCGDANNGVHGCATCRYGNGVECTRCSAGYLGVDGRSCGEDCSGNTQGACSEVVEESSSVKILSCRCVCKPTFYNSSGTCASCTDSCAVCKDGTSTGCQQCSPGKILNFSVVSSESADCVSQCVAGSECAECGLTIDGNKYCTRCKDSSTYPFNGVCVPDAQEDAYCAIYENGVCTACSEAAFLMSGGCYTTAHYPGDTICDKQAGGKCTTTKEGYGISADGKLQPCDPTCLECKAPGPGRCTKCPSGKLLRRAPAAATGSCIEPGACADGYYADGDACLPCVVPGCRACGRTSFCTECAGELFVGLDGRACLRECSGDRVVGEVSGGTRRCWCERGFAPALDRSGCVPAAECPPGTPWCASCDESGRCLSCAAPGHNIQVDQRTCAEGCGDRAAPDQGVCVCETGTVLDKDACVPINALTGRKMMVVTTSAAAAVLVIGVLAGFLCWWFICRGKRRCYR